jgi:type II secretory pathway predicted ATPase ExeA
MDYLEFFHLKDPPFGLTPDSTYFYPSKIHNDILASLDYAVTQKEGFSLITGEPGVGKTMSLKIFMDRWKEKAEIALILTPRLAPEEFLQAVLLDLHIPLQTANKNEMIQSFRDLLIERSGTGRRVIIIVDEAQNLPEATLEELRLLSNLETEKEKLLQIILVGQPELRSRLQSPGLTQLDQRVSVRVTLKPLAAEETIDYINYRVIKAGKGTAIFEDKAKKAIYRYSRGIPRLINLVASRAMMVAFVDSSQTIRKEHVQHAIRHVADAAAPARSWSKLLRYALAGLLVAVLVPAAVILYGRSRNAPARLQSVAGPQTQAVSRVAPANPPEATPVNRLAAPQVTAATASLGSPATTPPTAPATNLPAPSPQSADSTPGKTFSHLGVQPNSPAEGGPTKRMAVVAVNAARLRDAPTAESEVIHMAVEGDTFEVLDEWTQLNGNKWFKVRLPDGREGWIASFIIRFNAPR